MENLGFSLAYETIMFFFICGPYGIIQSVIRYSDLLICDHLKSKIHSINKSIGEFLYGMNGSGRYVFLISYLFFIY